MLALERHLMVLILSNNAHVWKGTTLPTVKTSHWAELARVKQRWAQHLIKSIDIEAKYGEKLETIRINLSQVKHYSHSYEHYCRPSK